MSFTREQIHAMNEANIAKFRASGGRLDGPFEGVDVLLLHTVGAKSGVDRVNPMQYQALGDGRIAVFASNAGSDRHPAWYTNLLARPQVTAEVGTETNTYLSRTAPGDERTTIWEKQKRDYPGFAGYEAATTREIPVVILEPI